MGAWRSLAGLPSASGVFAWEQRGGADCFWWTGKPGAMSHQVFLTSPSEGDLRDALASPDRPAFCDLVVRGIDTPEFIDAVAELQQSRSGTAPLMLCDLRDKLYEDRTEFRTDLVTTPKERAAALDLLRAIYGDPGGLTTFFQGAGVAEIVGAYAGNRLFASATVVPAGSTANIWSVATAEDARGRGAASAAVRAALRHAATSGLSTASLGTTDELVPWYERFGFIEVGRERSVSVALG